MNVISNTDLWNTLRKIYPSFKAHTAEATAEMFTDKGFESISRTDVTAINDFFELSVRVWLNQINTSHAKDPLEDRGFGEFYDMPFGDYTQRMAIDSVAPISAGWKGLKNGDSPDAWVVRKASIKERFFESNFDFASLISIPDDFQKKQIFISEYGMSEFTAGIYEALQNGYIIQKYTNKLEALNAAINSVKNPLKSTQIVNTPMSATPTDTELKNFLLSVMNVKETMELAPQTGAFNALGFKSTQDMSRLKLLVRQGIRTAINVQTLVGAFNPEKLNLNIDIIPVPNFGGLTPYYMKEEVETNLYPVYNSLGERVAWSETEGGDAVDGLTENDVQWKDPNEDIVAMLADKGLVFECRQNPYEVEPIRNPRGRYTNMWASSPNNTIATDALYNMVIFKNSAE